MNCQRNVNSILPTQLSHRFSYMVAILIRNHFESPNILTDVTKQTTTPIDMVNITVK
jgi:hypothetical protein